MFSLTVSLLFAALWVVAAPDTEAGKALREALVDAPARFLNKDRLGLLIAVVALLGLIALLFGAPELVALVGLADASLLVDFVAIGLVLGSAVRLKMVRAATTEMTRRLLVGIARLGRPHARAQARSPGPRRRKRLNPNDPDPLGGWPLAPAR